MKAFAVAEKAIQELCDHAAAAGDKAAHAVAFELLQGLRALGGWRAFPVAPQRGPRGNAAARQARYRARKRDASTVTEGVTSAVTQDVTRDVLDRNAVTSSPSSYLSLVKDELNNLPENREVETREGVTRDASPTSVTQKASRTSRDTRGTRCTMDYEPRPETVETLKRQGHKDPLSLLQDFRLYWVPLTGANATKLDWDLTFTRWVQRERPRNTSSTFVRHVQPSENRAWKLPEGAE